jgi:hypothetical protein
MIRALTFSRMTIHIVGAFSYVLKCYVVSKAIPLTCVQLGFNLSNGVTDTLESSTILIYLIQVKGIYTQKVKSIETRN